MNRSCQGEDEGVVEVLGLAKEFPTSSGPIAALRQVDLSVKRGEMVAIMGPSGSGKSTLLFILGLLLAPTRGSYTMNGRDMLSLDRSSQARIRRECLGFVFQSSDLIESATVVENVELPLIFASVERRKRGPRVMESLERVQMTHRLNHPANLLSAGERQRVAVARALVNGPALILADEPTGQLDKRNGKRIMDDFEKIAGEGLSSVVLVTHDPEVASRCPRVCYLEEGVLNEG